MKTVKELMNKGGVWLRAARQWIQRTKIGGDLVTWGTDETLYPIMTVKDVEELAAEVACAIYNENIHKEDDSEYINGVNWRFTANRKDTGKEVTGWILTNRIYMDQLPISKDEDTRYYLMLNPKYTLRHVYDWLRADSCDREDLPDIVWKVEPESVRFYGENKEPAILKLQRYLEAEEKKLDIAEHNQFQNSGGCQVRDMQWNKVCGIKEAIKEIL